MKIANRRRLWLRPMALALVAALAVVGCRSQDTSEPEPVVEEQAPVEEPQADEDAIDPGEVVELYGLPLPPDYFHVQRQRNRIRIATKMELEELAEYFEDHAVDVEIFRVRGRIELLPLRSHSGRATAFNYGGRNGHTVINYRRPPDHASPAQPRDVEAAEDEPSQGDRIIVAQDSRPPTTRRQPLPITAPKLPDWVEAKKGQPVQIRDEQGNLLAPGAKWGEPYIPPEGSHLYHERYRHLWGRPYGAW